MKKILAFFLCLFSTVSFSQIYTEFIGAVDESDTTFLLYRFQSKDATDPKTYNNCIYIYNDKTWQEKVFIKDKYRNSGENWWYSQNTSDFEYYGNKIDDYYALQNYYDSPGGSRKNDIYVFRGNSKVNTLSFDYLEIQELNIEISRQDSNLLYISSGNDFGELLTAPVKGKRYFLKSRDGGITLNPVETNFTIVSLNKYDDRILFGINNQKLYISNCDTSKVYTLVDSVYKWTDHQVKFYYSYSNKYIYTTAKKDSLLYLVVSKDNGNSWNGIVQSADPIVVTLDNAKPADIYYGSGKKIYYSSDYGNSFRLFNTVSDNIIGIHKRANSDFLYVVTESKRYKVTNNSCQLLLSSTTSVEDNNNEPKYYLEQNYPNPFNPSTKIDFKIDKATYVTLKVFDITGTEIITLFKGEKSPGNYSVVFNGSNLPSGIYFYRLATDKFQSVRKMCLVK